MSKSNPTKLLSKSPLLGKTNLIMVALASLILLYVFGVVIYNLVIKVESFHGTAEDERTEQYYINKNVHPNQDTVLEKFISFLC